MAASQRLSRGFHRLALFLAAIPLVAGVCFSVFLFNDHNSAQHKNQRLVCAHDYFSRGLPAGYVLDDPGAARNKVIALQQIGCSNREWDTVSYGEAVNPPAFTWLDALTDEAGACLGITLAISLAVYGLVRAIGWVIGGFAAT